MNKATTEQGDLHLFIDESLQSHELYKELLAGNYGLVVQSTLVGVAGIYALTADETEIAEMDSSRMFFLGAACLLAFVQLGWTGPAVEIAVGLDTKDASHWLQQLQCDGEEAYPLTPQPVLLHLARTVFIENIHSLKTHKVPLRFSNSMQAGGCTAPLSCINVSSTITRKPYKLSLPTASRNVYTYLL